MGSQATHIELDIVIDCAPFGKRELSARERETGRGAGAEGRSWNASCVKQISLLPARWQQIVMLLGKSIETDLQINPLARSDNEVRTRG